MVFVKGVQTLGFGFYSLFFFQFFPGQLEARYDLDLPLSLTGFSYSFSRGFISPTINPLSSSSSFSHRHPCLSHSCPHLMFFLQIHHLSVVMSSFLLSALQRSTSYSYIPFSPTRAGSIPIISPPYQIHVNVISIHSTRCACVCLCFILSTHSPSLIVILPPSLLHHSYTLYSSVLCPLYLCFTHTHARVSIFVTGSGIVNLRFTAYPPPPALPFTLDPKGSHPPTFVVPSLSSSSKLTASLIQPTTRAYHLILILGNHLLVRFVIAFAFQNAQLSFRSYRIFAFAVVSRHSNYHIHLFSFLRFSTAAPVT